MKKFITNKYVLTILGSILFLVIWIIISYSFDNRTMIFPDPFKTFVEAGKVLTKGYIYQCISWTMLRMLIGFTSAFAIALVFGIIAGHFPSAKTFLNPIIVALKSIPTAALVFLFLVISGARFAPIFVVILISFPILYEAISAGIANVPKEVIDAAEVDGAGWKRIALNIRLPLATPYILVGIASSFALSFKIEIMAEIITGDTKYGLGSAISAAQKNDPSNMVPIFAYSLIAVIFILIITIIEDLIVKSFKKN